MHGSTLAVSLWSTNSFHPCIKTNSEAFLTHLESQLCYLKRVFSEWELPGVRAGKLIFCLLQWSDRNLSWILLKNKVLVIVHIKHLLKLVICRPVWLLDLGPVLCRVRFSFCGYAQEPVENKLFRIFFLLIFKCFLSLNPEMIQQEQPCWICTCQMIFRLHGSDP